MKTVSYSTGQSGSRLTWLPIQPADAGGVVQAAATEPIGGPRTTTKAVQRAGGDAFADPFEDSKAKSRVAPATPLDSTSSEKSGVLPPAGVTPPKLPLNGPKMPEGTPKVIQPAQGSPMEKEFQVTMAPKGDECPDPNTVLVPVTKKNILEGVTPKPGEFPQWCSMGKDPFVPRSWPNTTFHWTASALCHKPVYFEDLQVERYGHTFGPWLQSVISGGHFFLSVPALPYAMGLFPPNECVYTLGYYRPGSCTPYVLDALPLSLRAILAEGGVWTGMVYLVP